MEYVSIVSMESLVENNQRSTQNKAQSLPSAEEIISEYANEGVLLRKAFFDAHSQTLDKAARCLAHALMRGKKILLCGNGGSAADAQHLAGEFVNRYLMDRPPLPAIALTTDTSALTAIGNDFGYEDIFSKQIQALGREGDVLIAISTSGNSPNVLKALHVCKRLEIQSIGLTGEGGQMQNLCDIILPVPHGLTPLIQEIHITAGHLLCRLVDYYLFENVVALQSADQ